MQYLTIAALSIIALIVGLVSVYFVQRLYIVEYIKLRLDDGGKSIPTIDFVQVYWAMLIVCCALSLSMGVLKLNQDLHIQRHEYEMQIGVMKDSIMSSMILEDIINYKINENDSETK